jgi:hypothetical protein
MTAQCPLPGRCPATAGISAGVAGVQDPTSQAPFKFDIIGFDACLMAMYEVGAALSPVANYMLASELLEPGTGWDYSYLGYLPLGQTAANTPVSAAAGFSERELAELLITGYMVRRAETACGAATAAFHCAAECLCECHVTLMPLRHHMLLPSQATPSTGLTLALTDLRQVASELEGSMSSLSTKLTQDMASTQCVCVLGAGGEGVVHAPVLAGVTPTVSALLLARS